MQEKIDAIYKNYNAMIAFGDNKEILANYINNPPLKKQFGMLYADNNGCPDYELIKNITNIKQYGKLDILINCPAASHKRSLKIWHQSNKINLSEALIKINKKYWIIREPYGKFQWTFLIGTNWQSFPKFGHLNFYSSTTNKGRDILKRLTYTAKELSEIEKNGFYDNYRDYLNHPFFKLIKNEALARASNYKGQIICEKCSCNIAIEPHHLEYPKWGTFDDDGPDKIKMVCRKCHCKLHDKEK